MVASRVIVSRVKRLAKQPRDRDGDRKLGQGRGPETGTGTETGNWDESGDEKRQT